MAKDPAILFYVQDFLIGSSLFTPLQKGHYITLLCYQQQSENGSLPEDQIKLLMRSDFQKHWPVIKAKFQKDNNGFFNQRMRAEIERRKKFSNRQRDNARKRWDNHGNATALPLETETEIETPVLKKGGMGGIEIDLKIRLPGNVLEAAEMNQYTLTKKKNTEFIECQWLVFLRERMNDPDKVYLKPSDLTSHFLNWIRNKHPKNGTHQSTSKRSTAADNAAAFYESARAEYNAFARGEADTGG